MCKCGVLIHEGRSMPLHSAGRDEDVSGSKMLDKSVFSRKLCLSLPFRHAGGVPLLCFSPFLSRCSPKSPLVLSAASEPSL